MSINPFYQLQFQDKLGQVISGQNIYQLNDLKKEVHGLVFNSIQEEDRLFYKESLELITASLLALNIAIHENVKPTKISEVNQKVLEIAKQQGEIYQAIHKTFRDPDISPYLEKKSSAADEIPYPEIYVNAQQSKGRQLEEELSNMLASNDYVEPSKKEIVKGKLSLFYSKVDNFQQALVKDLWDKTTLSKRDVAFQETASVSAIDREDSRMEMFLQNVLFDEHSATRDVSNAEFTEGRIYGDGNCGFSATNTTRQEVVTYLKDHINDDHTRQLVAPEIRGWLLTCEESPRTKGYFEKQKQLDQEMKFILNEIEAKTGVRPSLELEGINAEEIILHWEEIKQHLARGEAFQDIHLPKESLALYSRLLEAKNRILDELSMDQEVFREYIEQYYEKGGYLVLPDPQFSQAKPQSTGVISVIAEMKNAQIRVWKLGQSDHTVYLRYQTGATGTNQGQILDLIHRGLHYNKLIPSEQLSSTPIQLNDEKRFAGLNIYTASS